MNPRILVALSLLLVPATAAAAPADWVAANAPALLTDFLGRAAWRWLAALATIAFVLTLRRPVMSLLVGAIRNLTGKTETKLDNQIIEAVERPLRRLVLVSGIYFGLLWPQFPARPQAFIDSGFTVAVILIVGWAALRSIDIALSFLTGVAAKTDNRLDDHLVPLVGRILRVAVIALVALVALQELGINVAGLIAGLGVGGLALALAAKDTVANWFGALMIYTDRPFEIGDTIKTSGVVGAVEDVGLRSTRIRTVEKTLVTMPNSTLANGQIENLSWRTNRKAVANYALSLDTSAGIVRASTSAIQEILATTDGIKALSWDVNLTDVTATEMTLLVQYLTQTTAWSEFLAIREDVHLKVLEALSEAGARLAVPTTQVIQTQAD
ncbi:MAG: MscS family membrane protein [Bradymonadia bacterium]|jgi:MscS family membrane protein